MAACELLFFGVALEACILGRLPTGRAALPLLLVPFSDEVVVVFSLCEEVALVSFSVDVVSLLDTVEESALALETVDVAAAVGSGDAAVADIMLLVITIDNRNHCIETSLCVYLLRKKIREKILKSM